MLGILSLECSRHAPLKGRPHDPPAARQPAHGGRERRGPQVDRTRGGTHGGVPVLLHRDHEELILVITGAQIYTHMRAYIRDIYSSVYTRYTHVHCYIDDEAYGLLRVLI